jgi:hypothetical protein
MLPHHETDHQRSINNIWSCILDNQGFLRIGAPITELLTTARSENETGKKENTYSKIINVADCKTSQKRSLAVKYLILIMLNYPTAKTGKLSRLTDGPAGQPADNPPNSDGLGYLHRTVSKLTVQVSGHPGPPIWQRFGSDPDPDPKWRLATVSNNNNWLAILESFSMLLCTICISDYDLIHEQQYSYQYNHGTSSEDSSAFCISLP